MCAHYEFSLSKKIYATKECQKYFAVMMCCHYKKQSIKITLHEQDISFPDNENNRNVL